MSWEPKPPSGERGITVGIEGPPGGGKTVSSLLLAQGMQEVRGGPIILIDTENRANKYRDIQITTPEGRPIGRPLQYLVVKFDPPFRANRFEEAIIAQLKHNPACIIVDSLSDEHEGKGGRLQWMHEVACRILRRQNRNPDYDPSEDEEGIKRVSQLAYQPSSAARHSLALAIQSIGGTPLILTFRAREKTKPVKEGSRTTPTNIGYQPIAPLEYVHQLDIVCLLPPRSDGLPMWRSDKLHQDFVLKLPQQFRGLLREGQRITPEIGAALARWAKGDDETPSGPARNEAPATQTDKPKPQSFSEYVGNVCDQDGETGLRELRDTLESRRNEEKVRWINERWDELLERARKADAAQAAPEPALPGL